MATNTLAKTLKDLHVPSKPVIFANVWDIASLNTILSLNRENPASKPVKAVATASWAVAAALGIQDEELTFEQNLAAIRAIGPVVAKAGLPLSVDLQDGYGGRIAEAVTAAVQAGAHGANLEDSIPSVGVSSGIEGSLYPLDKQVQRLRSALEAAADAGCPEFALNARCDAFVLDESPELDDETRMQEAVRRGKAYLDAGATTVFYWGSDKLLTAEGVKKLVEELDGRVAIQNGVGGGALSTADLGNLGVARISVGPRLYRIAMEAVKKSALNLLQGGNL